MRIRRQSRSRHRASNIAIALVLAALVGIATRPWVVSGQEPTETDELLAHARYLASPELAGRGVNTPGVRLARDYVAAEFAKYGLLPGGDNNSYLQSFEVAVGVQVKAPSRMALGREPALRLHEDWLPLGLSLSAQVEGEAVFAGYGITAKDYGYDDYAGIDACRRVIDESRRPLVRFGTWPRGAKSAFSVTGDIDALTIWDFVQRFRGL